MERRSVLVWWFPVVFVMALVTPAVGLSGFIAEGYVRGTTTPSGPAAQVFIDTQILQASDNFTGALGVDWDVEVEANPRTSTTTCQGRSGTPGGIRTPDPQVRSVVPNRRRQEV